VVPNMGRCPLAQASGRQPSGSPVKKDVRLKFEENEANFPYLGGCVPGFGISAAPATFFRRGAYYSYGASREAPQKSGISRWRRDESEQSSRLDQHCFEAHVRGGQPMLTAVVEGLPSRGI
jgi:hypothetical protein